MTRRIVFSVVLPRILIALFLLELITACNSAIPPSTRITSRTNLLSAQIPSLLQQSVYNASFEKGANRSSAQDPSPPTPSIGKAMVLTTPLGGVLNIVFNPLDCSLSDGTVISNAVVLASPQLEYDEGSITQMDTYFQQFLKRAVDEGEGVFDFNDPPVPPPTLNETSGGLVGVPAHSDESTCQGNLQITNIGNKTIQITGVNMQLLSDTQLNQYNYRLIDICSLPSYRQRNSSDPGCLGLGGGGLKYTYTFNLSMAKAGQVFPGQSPDQPSLNQPLLDPGQVAFIYLYFQSSENLIYFVAPQITFNLLDGPNTSTSSTYTLFQWASTLGFANPDQFSCYKFQDNTNTLTQIDFSKGFCV